MIYRRTRTGFAIPAVMMFIVVIAILATTVFSIIALNLGTLSRNVANQRALDIAEAGLNYYMWHLAHNPSDYRDGQSFPTDPVPGKGYGPYVHAHSSVDGTEIGTYTLWVEPVGSSSIAIVRSTGTTLSGSVSRTVEARVGSPSYAHYSVLSDTVLWFAANEQALGPVHSNTGVRMDGRHTDTVSSAQATYTIATAMPDEVTGTTRPGVWCNESVLSPINCSSRDKSAWKIGVPAIDFNGVTSSLCDIKKTARNVASDPTNTSCTAAPTTRTAGYLPRINNKYSRTSGYLIELNANNTYNLYRVSSEDDKKPTYGKALNNPPLIASNIVIPENDVIFAEDNVWIRSNPVFKGRLTIGAGRMNTNDSPNITIIDDLVYSTKDGTDTIGLIAEGNIDVAPYAPPRSDAFTFEVNASVVAQTGAVRWPRYYYTKPKECSIGFVKPNQKFYFYGSVASRLRWTWSHYPSKDTKCGDTVFLAGYGYVGGFHNTVTEYDKNLLYNPPPHYPITNKFNILSWREILRAP